MEKFEYVAVVNLLEDCSGKEHHYALYPNDKNKLDNSLGNCLVVVDHSTKNKFLLGRVQRVVTAESCRVNVTAQVVGVIDLNEYDSRIEKTEQIKQLKKNMAELEKKLDKVVKAADKVKMYEKLVEEYKENEEIKELVEAYKNMKHYLDTGEL